MSYKIQIKEKIPTIEEYQLLRNSVGWSKVSNNAVEKSLKNSIFSVCALLDEEVVGFGRIIGDDGIYYYIQDVMVFPKHQKKGIGRQIMDRLMDFLENHADETAFFGLMAAKGNSRFYEPYGFMKRPYDAPGMFRYCKAKK
ncbi:MAG: GNAT family N-acetyltransferase [Candidatus Hodarchaeota archaeon]